METQISVPSRALARERSDAKASTERLDEFAFWYFTVSLGLSCLAAAWVALTL